MVVLSHSPSAPSNLFHRLQNPAQPSKNAQVMIVKNEVMIVENKRRTHRISNNSTSIPNWILRRCKPQVVQRRSSIPHTQPLCNSILQRHTLILVIGHVHQWLDGHNSRNTQQARKQRRPHDCLSRKSRREGTRDLLDLPLKLLYIRRIYNVACCSLKRQRAITV